MKIRIRDWSEYDPARCNNGGAYMFGDNYVTDFWGWRHEEVTSAEFCPYCHRFDCGGDCDAARDEFSRIVPASEVCQAVKAALAGLLEVAVEMDDGRTVFLSAEQSQKSA